MFIVYNSVFNYVQQTELLSDNGSQLRSKFFMELCCSLNMEKVLKKIFNLKTNGRADRFNQTKITSL